MSSHIDTLVTPETAGWTYSSLRVAHLAPGDEVSVSTGDEEWLIVPLAGGCEVSCAGQKLTLTGRIDVFDRVTDFAYVPRRTQVALTSAAPARIALAGALAQHDYPVRYGAAEDVSVEIRGAGQATRQVNNFASPAQFETAKVTAVEVLTPGGNWSSYPPHKHDRAGDGEAELEEIYYFEVAGADGHVSDDAVGYQRVYASDSERAIDVLTDVHTGDVVTVPYGYHGPSMACPGYDLYYLNVLAGPAEERSMAFCDDPAHAWIRGSWDGMPIDPRVPMTGPRSRREQLT